MDARTIGGAKMYKLLVIFRGGAKSNHSLVIERATDVLTTIRDIMQKHPGCERVEVLVMGERLFSVDCKGNTTPG